MDTENSRFSVMLRDESAISKLASQFPIECKPVFDDVCKCRKELLNQLSAQMPNAVNFLQTVNAADTYKVVGDIALQQGEDGLFSAVRRGPDGQIIEHVKLEKSVSDVARAATFAYSIINAAVGQANMMSIAERLAEIEVQLDEAKSRDYIEKVETVKSACVGLREALCLKEDDHRKQTILERRNDLRTALSVLREYIKLEISKMPEYHKKGFLENILSNWGTKNSTLPEKARRRFEYIINTLPVWCRGMSQLLLTDPYVDDFTYQSAKELIDGLRGMIIESRLSKRVVYVPLMGQSDPIEIVQDFERRIPETKRAFAQMRSRANSGAMTLELV